MSERLHYFTSSTGTLCLASSPDIFKAIDGWEGLSVVMAKKIARGFSRDEWAYLAGYLDRAHLESVYLENLGEPVAAKGLRAHRLLRPRGRLALWLPNNASLLGSLMVILCSLSGNALKIKGGSRGQDLTAEFIKFAQKNLPGAELKEYLAGKVEYSVFAHPQAPEQGFFKDADAAIVFGTDEAVAQVKLMAQPPGCISFPFPDRQSQAWIQAQALNRETLIDLLKTFAVYGQAGCSSPAKIILLGGSMAQARALRDRLCGLWPQIFTLKPEPAVASANVSSFQLAKATGWEPVLAPDNAAVISYGRISLPIIKGKMVLHISAATLERAQEMLPASIQTIGYAVADPKSPRWLKLLASTRVKRFVPIAQMQDLGPLWDGLAFWRGLFEEVQL